MQLDNGTDWGLLAAAFALGMMLVHRVQQASRHRTRSRPATQASVRPRWERPASQLAVHDAPTLARITCTEALLRSIEQRSRFSQAMYERDAQPLLLAFAEFVQLLPASESHHHAQPGGLWIHSLEVVDAALTYRAGIELPPGASTEVRKQLEHRWTFAVLTAALLHDVGKPVSDLVVTLFAQDPRAGTPWIPLAGPMRGCGASHYAVAFVDGPQRSYAAHQKLAAMLLHRFLPPRLMQWLADGDVLLQLLAYLAGEDPEGALGSLIRRADSDSVRRNLLHGPRTRFATARVRPLIERLMEALRRMLLEGAALPLNRPGAAGWIHNGCAWLVCARLADEVRSYLAQHESLQGVPGKDRNDRLFDTWQEYGACRASPDGGAVWRVRVQCETWRSPDLLTVLCFPLDKLYADPTLYPAPLHGEVLPEGGPVTPSAEASPDREPQPRPRAIPSAFISPSEEPAVLAAVPADSATPPSCAPQPAHSVTETSPSPDVPCPDPTHVATPATATGRPAFDPDSGVLSLRESASLVERVQSAPAPRTAVPATLGPPTRPHVPGGQPRPVKAASPAAEAFMAWVVASVGNGSLKYNQEHAMVHFAPQGCLLLSPELFKRFIDVHRELDDGPVVELLASHGQRAYARLQNELTKSGWTQRNGDENLHYQAFTKADGSLSRVASFYLIPKPQLFWNPVPSPNDRIRPAPRPRKAPTTTGAGATDAAGSSAMSAETGHG